VDTLIREPDRRFSRGYAVAARLLNQRRSVPPDLLVDSYEVHRLAPAVILGGCADIATGIDDGQDQDAAGRKHGLRPRRTRNITSSPTILAFSRPALSLCNTSGAPGGIQVSQVISMMGVLYRALHRLQGEVAVRRIQGLLSFARKYGVARVDDACAAAAEVESYDYRFVRR